MEYIEDTEFVATEHDRLVSAISKLDKTQHITEPTRNEPTNVNSEFNLIKKSNKLNINNIAKLLENTSNLTHVSRKLKKTQTAANVLSKPLEKPQAERVKRSTGYDETKKRIGRWDPVVARSRTVDCISFPLKTVSTKLQPTGEFLSRFETKSELERELEEVDPPALTEVDEEEEPLVPISYEDMVEHRKYVAKLRARESYKMAKAKRQSKIKSKRYHRILKKEKLKQQLNEFQKLQQIDPEEALKKLDAIEKARALERHTLRHKNSGKWAKSKIIKAKYNKEVRQELAEQLQISRKLTKKVPDNQSSEDESVEETTIDVAQYKRSVKNNDEFDFNYKKFTLNKNKEPNSDSESNEDDEAKKDIMKSMNAINLLDTYTKIQYSYEDAMKEETDLNKKEIKSQKTNVSCKGQSVNSLVATSKWLVETVDYNENNTLEEITSAFDKHEMNVKEKVERKLKKYKGKIERLEQASKVKSEEINKIYKEREERDNLEYLKIKKKNSKAVIDEELFETTSMKVDEEITNENPQISKVLSNNVETGYIDSVNYLLISKELHSSNSRTENECDTLDDEQVLPITNMKEGLEEAYEDCDLELNFRQEKEDTINKDTPEIVHNSSLPGWGSWAGKGVKPPKRKKNRFITKPAPKMPRRDENKGDIIIKEYKDPKLGAHKVKDVPFPFESVKDYEASIRAPLGNTFIPEKAHQKLIRPSVVTKAGAIIEPMDEQELLVPKNRNFKNKNILKLLGQK